MADIVFMALHGENGENGKIQAAFDLFGIRYTGSDYLSSAIAMNKGIAKQFFLANNIPTPGGITMTKENREDDIKKLPLTLPCIVKPCCGGSSIGVTIVRSEEEFIEIAPIQGFYDYKNKYKAGSAVETCPAELPEEVTKQMQKYAEEVAKCVGLDTYSRTDFLLNDKNEIFCLEANTLPGMTPTSLLPQEAAVVGVNFNQLCEHLIAISLKKYEDA